VRQGAAMSLLAAKGGSGSVSDTDKRIDHDDRMKLHPNARVLGNKTNIETKLVPDYLNEQDAFTVLALGVPDILERLMAYGRELGYVYPDNPADMLPKPPKEEEAQDEPKPSPEATPLSPAEIYKMEEPKCHRMLSARTDLLVVPSKGLLWCPTSGSPVNDAVFELLGPSLNVSKASWADTSKGKPAELAPHDAEVKLSGTLSKREVHKLCKQGMTSFTVVSDPWLRLINVYMSQIASSDLLEQGQDEVRPRQSIRKFHQLTAFAKITFSQFVQWLSAQPNRGGVEYAWMPHSVRCDPEHVPYSLVARQETLEQDMSKLTDRLGMPRGTSEMARSGHEFPALAGCARSSACNALMTSQAGAEWKTMSPQELSLKMYAADPMKELPRLVGEMFQADTYPFGYTYDSSSTRRYSHEVAR